MFMREANKLNLGSVMISSCVCLPRPYSKSEKTKNKCEICKKPIKVKNES
jgi:hypothetical protein